MAFPSVVCRGPAVHRVPSPSPLLAFMAAGTVGGVCVVVDAGLVQETDACVRQQLATSATVVGESPERP